jgi:hypothetical protein
MRREVDHAIAIPMSLVSRLAKATSKAEARRLDAKEQADFGLFAPALEEVVALTRDRARALGNALKLAPYDALIDEFSPGFLSAEIDQLFRAVSRRLPGLIRDAIELQAQRPPLPVRGKVGVARQRQLVNDVMKTLGFPVRSRAARRERPDLHRRVCRVTCASRRGSTRRIRSPASWACCTRRGRPCTTWVCPRPGAISRSAAIAAWRSTRASHCCSRC